MARFVFGMNVSLDGYVDHEAFAPDPVLFEHWIDQVSASAGAVYGRKMYQIMSYWEEDQPDWGPQEHAFATAWRRQHKWVVSNTLKQVGPNAELVSDNFEHHMARIKQTQHGEIDVSGTHLAQSLGQMGLIDEYRLYFHPIVLGQGRPMFTAPLPRLQPVSSQRIGNDVTRLTFRPA